MFTVETYTAARIFVFNGGSNRPEAARVFNLSRNTIAKMCRFFGIVRYVRSKAPKRPKLGPSRIFLDFYSISYHDRASGGMTFVPTIKP